MNETDILLKLNDHENEINQLNHRMKNQEQQSKAINDLAISVRELAVNMKNMHETQCSQDKRLNDLESKPGKRWEQIVSTALTTIIGAVIGFLISQIGL